VDPLRRIAETVLYEGHVLWPYRRSAPKNRERWTFGRLHPIAHHAQDEAASLQTQVILEAGKAAHVDVTVRFLQSVKRRVMRGLDEVDGIEVDGQSVLAWNEATEREIAAPGIAVGDPPRRQSFAVEPGGAEEPLCERTGARVGTLVWDWRALSGELEFITESIGAAAWRVTVRVTNTTPAAGGGLASTFLSTHVALRADGGQWVSMTDPPPRFLDAVAGCRNVGVWPVLVGESGDRTTMLAAPIVLYDHPQIAPESVGDFFDVTEIDELLVLNVLALTDDERREMAASDPRTRAIVERCTAMSRDDFMRLHGVLRDVRALGEA
jgi:hypothetical protein